MTKLSYNSGFDEINYDYIRYPADGDLKDVTFPCSKNASKSTTLEEFFAYLRKKTLDEDLYKGVVHQNTGRKKEVPWISADLFGCTTNVVCEPTTGQCLESVMEHFDFVAPMVYPSHYPKGFAHPNSHPYEMVHRAMSAAVQRASVKTVGTLRTWIQGFGYTAQEIRAQIEASRDAGVHSWMVWSSSNKYIRDAFEPSS